MKLIERVKNIFENGEDGYDRGLRKEIESIEQVILDNAEKGYRLSSVSVDVEYVDRVIKHLSDEGFVGIISNVNYEESEMVTLYILPKDVIAPHPVTSIRNLGCPGLKVDPPFEETKIGTHRGIEYMIPPIEQRMDDCYIDTFDPTANGGTGGWTTELKDEQISSDEGEC